MSKCEFCAKEHDRLLAHSTTKVARYCSTLCIKRAYYIRKNPHKKSYFINKTSFYNTSTGKGFKWEEWAAKKFSGNHMRFNASGPDVILPNGESIDVKMCELYKSPRGVKWWTFNRNKHKKIDWILCVGLVEGILKKVWMIPSDAFPYRGATIGLISKYDIYAREDLVE